MDHITLTNEITSFCRGHADDKVVEKYARFFKDGRDGYDAYGVSTELIQSKISELCNNKLLTLNLLLEAAPSLLKSGKYEETIFLLLLTEKHCKELSAVNFDDIGKWFDYGITNWAQCDTLSAKIIPRFFLKKMVSLERLAEWQDSTFRFQRRAIPVSLVKLLKTTEDYTLFFNLISPLMLDDERVVHQGLGWFLREAWKKQPEQTGVFLMKWKDSAARLIFQYATEKMDISQRARFRKTKLNQTITDM
jgi:3-methyladenine DNA glycosylase AlkD